MADEQSVVIPIDRVPWRRGIVAESAAMKELLALTEKIAPSTLSVVLHGETGSGKDVIARAIHSASRRRGRFIAFNCATVPASLAESELFGHVRGAFTGADHDRRGLFSQAHGGTLFLDEIAELEPGIQAKLLRVLEDGEVRPVGATGPTEVDVRVVVASHRDLTQTMDGRQFRLDLYHRLAGITLTIAPLRERPEDIAPLTRRFVGEAASEREFRLAPDAWDWLQRHLWPGNVRQLRQTVHRAVALAEGCQLTADDFRPFEPRIPSSLPTNFEAWLAGRSWAELERDVLTWALKRYGSIRAAAAALGRPHSTLHDRVRRLGLDRPTKR